MKLIAAVIASLFVVGCEAGAPEPTAPTQVSTDADGLVLRVSSPERIAGTYTDPTTNVGVVFESARSGDELYLHIASTSGAVLVHAETTVDDYVFSYMDGKATLTVSKAWVAQVKAEGDDGPAAADESAARWTGDRTVLDAMLQLPEVQALPWMSRALGMQGITGSEYPASMALHKTAKQSAKALDIELPPIQQVDGDVRCTRPTANECYGMCGNGCNCWSWVCGDCCYHSGCAKHDSWCRSGQWYYCYNITAVIALFGC